ncbi:ATP-binding protein [Tenacibaculum sp. 1B UA]|uniref:sensor histidine kinase n=1 Tax=Tenacibaculum sp. 1B UA TaxID=2922252 RepID=UPI002A24CCD8|nr:ATP-binding protein [Tenacibaculum sp. 1B UA]MDX8553911.1 ATP-binding protein [Tenacibaculum sp. 1B UA]
MEQQEGRILIVTTIVIVIIIVFLVTLFTVFQRRKNKLLQERDKNKKRYEREIAETQIEIREETLRNISWELHDNIGQLLTLAKIQLQHASPESMEEISEIIAKSLTEVRALSKIINPDFINNIKLKDALNLEVERFNRLNYIDARLTITGEEQEINQKHGIIIFRILQEFFSNTIKHSKASKLEVFLSYKEDSIEVKAQDNGVGFDMERARLKGLGLQNIKARAKLINAEAKFTSEPQKGTSLIINYYI